METNKKSFFIKGMHCASCVYTNEKALKKVPGVVDAVVNLATNKATITANTEITDQQLTDAIKSVGYQAIFPKNDDEKDLQKKEKTKELKQLQLKSLISLFVGLLIVWGTFPRISNFAPKIFKDFYTQFILATFIQAWAGYQFYEATIPALKNRLANMDTLVAVGTTVAYLYSVFVIFFPSFFKKIGIEAMPYFDVSTIIIALILLGRYLEAKAKAGTSDAIKKLIGLQAKTARVVRNDKEVDVPISEVVVGDVIQVRPGERIPVDGTIVDGEATVDESMVTGESMPVDKSKGKNVIGSTINKNGTFMMRAEKVGSETMLSQIIRLVEEAQASKAPIQRLVDIVSSYFVPAVIILSVATFTIWYLLPNGGLIHAMLNSIAVLIIACPCAMGLATPTAIMVGTGRGAESGILIKDAESLELANKIKAVVFDKTGTLTKGEPEVTDIIIETRFRDFLTPKGVLAKLRTSLVAKNPEFSLLLLAASVEKGSEHPLGEAIVKRANKEGLKVLKTSGFRSITGHGVEGTVDGKRVYVGKIFQSDKEDDQAQSLKRQGKTVVYVYIDKKIAGFVAIADTVKDTAKSAIAALNKSGIETYMITGDNRETANAIGKALGMKKENILAEVLPADKEKEVRKIKKLTGSVVAFVGDGINDAPALASADFGIAMGSGSDIAIETAPVTLVNKDLKTVASAITLSKKTMMTIKLNLFWAFAYNVILIPIAILGKVSPILASGAMAFSSVSVVTNSLLLKKQKL